ncbi:MAG: sulfite oxidase [Limnochordaceae bacterium]|uniref:DUF3303 family protein n=1 Tax=Carboxydichorda subterranea TaxID=3109565 RepID=A0ABZ1C1D8_9FIRM|nr:DUF3303 family protein [Limnochorda sp. L945t]MBE3598351.1 sulfite oxidase [Limnochordaceae bacterium]WRP18118.1 DUF3303 family protein [Limnochorda sp. L945t]
MALFVVRHQHPPESCPARDPRMGMMLLRHLSEANARQHGITLHGEGVVDGQHTLYLIVEADGREKVEAFMQPFAQAGSVEVWPASRCETVVSRQGC